MLHSKIIFHRIRNNSFLNTFPPYIKAEYIYHKYCYRLNGIKYEILLMQPYLPYNGYNCKQYKNTHRVHYFFFETHYFLFFFKYIIGTKLILYYYIIFFIYTPHPFGWYQPYSNKKHPYLNGCSYHFFQLKTIYSSFSLLVYFLHTSISFLLSLHLLSSSLHPKTLNIYVCPLYS